MGVRYRILAASGAYLRQRLTRLARLLMQRGGGARAEIIDGYLLRVRGSSDAATAVLMDIPQRITWSGGVDAAHYGVAPAGLLVHPYLALPMRDMLLDERLGEFDWVDAAPLTLNNQTPAYFTDGAAGINTASVLGNTHRTRTNFLTHCWVSIFFQSAGRVAVGAWDHLRAGDQLAAICAAQATPIANGAVRDGELQNAPLPKLDGRVSVVVGENWAHVRTGKRMCGRYYRPTDPPTPADPDQGAFRDAQAPWCTALAIHLAPGVMRWIVAMHQTVQDNEIADLYGARSGYVVSLLAVNDPTVAPPGLYLVGEFQRENRLDAAPNRQPEFVPGQEGGPGYHRANGHQPYHHAVMNDELAVLYAAFHVTRGAGGDRLFTAELLLIDIMTGALLSTMRVTDGTGADQPAALWAGCYGIDSPGDGTAVAITGNPLVVENAFGVVLVLNGGAGFVTEAYSTDFVRYGGNFGQSLGCVEYIGNGKFAFPVSSAEPAQPEFLADWCVAVYDANAKTMGLAGQIEPERDMLLGENRYTGRMCCVQEEIASTENPSDILRYATVLATIGPYGLVEGQPGGEAGRTYISYDSCQTWRRVCDYGSPRGVMYGASPAFSPEPRKLVRRPL